MKKTLRLLLTLDCNLTCQYCCNNISEINSKFIKKKLDDINFDAYSNVCISGGEPLVQLQKQPDIYSLYRYHK